MPACEHCHRSPVDCTCVSCDCNVCSSENCDCLSRLDTLVTKASVPNLGALMRQGKKSGLIKPVPQY